MSEAIDANVLLYASDEESPRQPGAQRLLERLASGPDLVYVFWPVATLMRQHGVSTIWTADRDFQRFPGITTRDPYAESAR